MLDSVLASRLSPVTARITVALAHLRIAGVHQTALGFVFGLAAAVLVMAGLPLVALIPLLIGVLLRVVAPPTPLDRMLDFVAWCAIAFAFALADPPRALAAAFLIFAMALLDAARSTDREKGPLFTRPIEQTELVIAFGLSCLLPNLFSIVAYLVGILCFLSAGFSLARSNAR